MASGPCALLGWQVPRTTRAAPKRRARRAITSPWRPPSARIPWRPFGSRGGKCRTRQRPFTTSSGAQDSAARLDVSCTKSTKVN